MAEAQPSGVRLAFRTRATTVELDALPTRQVYAGAPHPARTACTTCSSTRADDLGHHAPVDRWLSGIPEAEDFDDWMRSVVGRCGLVPLRPQESYERDERHDGPHGEHPVEQQQSDMHWHRAHRPTRVLRPPLRISTVQ